MMQPRCAVCDGDNDVMTLCDWHHWLCVIRHNVDVGLISDWPPLDTGHYPAVVKHRTMLLRRTGGPLSWQTLLAVTLTGKGVLLSRTVADSEGDKLAVNGLLDFGDTENGKAAA